MEVLFIEYPPCSTCKKAKKFLKEHGLSLQTRHIVEKTPTFDELSEWIYNSNYPLKKFFNTSGKLYRELNLKEKLPSMPEVEQIKLLSENGMLIKRPIVIYKKQVLVGFNEQTYKEVLGLNDDK